MEKYIVTGDKAFAMKLESLGFKLVNKIINSEDNTEYYYYKNNNLLKFSDDEVNKFAYTNILPM